MCHMTVAWSKLGKAKGEDGKDGEDGEDGKDGADGKDGVSGGSSIFSDVKWDNDNVWFYLTDGTVITIPKRDGTGLVIKFSVEQGVALVPGTTLKVRYNILGGDDQTLVRLVNTSVDDADVITAVVKPLSASHGEIYIYIEEYDLDDEREEIFWDENFGDVTIEEALFSNFTILVSVSDGSGNSILKSLNFVEGVVDSITDAYIVDAVSGSVTAEITTNVAEDFYEVVIDQKALPWLSYVPTKATMRTDELVFSYKENTSDKFRTAFVELKNEMNQVLESFVIVQRSTIAGDIVQFADDKVKRVCVGRYDKNLDGELTYEEIATVTDLTNLFLLEKNITSFDELEYFTSVTKIPDELFKNCEKLVSVKLPEGIKVIGSRAFDNCKSLKEIEIPEGIEGYFEYEFSASGIGSYCFSGCSSLEKVVLPSTLIALPEGCFYGCVALKNISLPSGIESIPYGCFWGCTSLESVEVSSVIRSIGARAFASCSYLSAFDLSAVENIGHDAFYGSGLKEAVMMSSELTTIGECTFAGCENLEKVILPESFVFIARSAFERCTCLRNIEFPESLETIGLDAFAGSALEGKLIEGTNIKALVIPAKVNHVNQGAFEGCKNLSAVKMLPVYPPDNYGRMFDSYIPIYVHPESVEAYKSASGWSEYTILPYDMMSVSLGLSVAAGSGVEYDESSFKVPVSVTVTGEKDKLSSVEEFGYYVKTVDDYRDTMIEYYPVEALNKLVECKINVNSAAVSFDYENYQISGSFTMGAYIRMLDGTIVTYANTPLEFVYDSKPSVTFTGVEIKSVDSGYVKFELECLVEGACWINGWDAYGIGEGYIYDFSRPRKDGVASLSGTWIPSSGVSEDMYIYARYYDQKYCEYFTNYLHLSFDASGNASAEITDAVGPMSVSLRDFLYADEGDSWYTLSGYISQISNRDYGNCYITDGDYEVYVYGITKTQVANNDKSFASLNLKVGDYVTICGKRSSYKGEAQVGGAYYVSHKVYAQDIYDTEVSDFLNYYEPNVHTLYRLTGTISSVVNTTFGNFYMFDQYGNEVYVYGLRKDKNAGNQTFAELGIESGDVVTIVGYRSEYGGVHQMENAYYESHTEGLTPTAGQLVDLGLSVKWAGWNVGASKPEEYGGYYSWGELTTKSVYNNDSYAYYSSVDNEFQFIGEQISGTQYDVAYSEWGDGWRLPTYMECYELYNDCEWIPGAYNNVAGSFVVGPNGNNIFIPYAGYIWNEEYGSVGKFANIWTGSDYDSWYSTQAYELHCSMTHENGVRDWGKSYGISVRPVFSGSQVGGGSESGGFEGEE